MMKLIMFDMDGTLYRTETSFFPAVREFARRHAFAAPDETFLRGFIGQNGSNWRAWLGQLQLGTSIDELEAEFDLLEKEYVEIQGELFPGVTDVLKGLAQDGWKLGICSNAPSWYPETILNRAGVRDLFTVIRVPSRPDQTKVMMLCDVWNELHPEHCAMVGDRADDMQAAFAGGFFAIGAVYGWAPEELERADVRIHDIAEIPTALAHHWSQEGEPESSRAPATVVSAPVAPKAPTPVVPTVPAAAIPVVPSVAIPRPPAAQTAVTTAKTREPMPPAEPTVPVLLPEETPPGVAHTPPQTAPKPMPETPVVARPVSSPIQTSPEPPAKPPAVAPPVRAPAPTAPPVHPTPPTAAPHPAKAEPPAPERRSWNPFRRHEDK